jgi:hypothetical protein
MSSQKPVGNATASGRSDRMRNCTEDGKRKMFIHPALSSEARVEYAWIFDAEAQKT